MVALTFGPQDQSNRFMDAFMTMRAARTQQEEAATRQAAAEREADAYARQLEADEAMRQGLTALPANAPREAVTAALTKSLGAVPGSGKTLYDLRAADWTRADKAAETADTRDFEMHKLDVASGLRRDEIAAQSAAQLRGQANAYGMQARLQEDRQREATETRVATMIGEGKVDLARQLAEQNGIQYPATFWTKAQTDAGLQQIIAAGAKSGDDAWTERAFDAYLQTGDVEQSLRVAGPPKVSAATTGHGRGAASQPGEVAKAEWLVANLGLSPDEAWRRANSADFSPEKEAADAATVLIEQGRETDFAVAYQKALRSLTAGPADADPLGMGFDPAAAPDDADPLGLR